MLSFSVACFLHPANNLLFSLNNGLSLSAPKSGPIKIMLSPNASLRVLARVESTV